MRWAVFITVIALSGAAHAQSVPPTLSCDVLVNDITITFPKGWMEFRECKALADDLDRKDKTGAHIQCICQRGVNT